MYEGRMYDVRRILYSLEINDRHQRMYEGQMYDVRRIQYGFGTEPGL